MQPELSRIASFYHGYIERVTEDELTIAFANHTSLLFQTLESIPSSRFDHSYGPGKWTVREVVQHLIDTERVFAYRALCFARKHPTPLPGFDENLFAANSEAHRRDWHDLLNEFKHVRESSRLLFDSFDEQQMEAAGTANNNPMYVRAIGYALLGHATHHLIILKERYGI